MMDPMDVYSRPVDIIQKKLGTLFQMKPRDIPERPGRKLTVNFDNRYPLVDDFSVNYTYLVKFDEIGKFAGNHYHIKKRELFVPVNGDVDVILEDPKTKERETISIESDKSHIFYVKPLIAHKVVAKTANAILLVLATSANNLKDEFEYKIN